MSLIPYLAIAFTMVTIGAALVTGKRLGERRKALFQLEMRAEELRRQAAELHADGQRAENQVRALESLRLQRREALANLYDELRDGESRQVGVSLGLRQRAVELEEMAA